jgi:ornithine cyclodeaminase/alanine dehydrogenase-like protein (mu-crystallin family)
VLRENTSLHLAQIAYGTTGFITGTLAQLIRGECSVERDRPVIFSPFGLGMLDIALGRWVYEQAVAQSEEVGIADFFDFE